MLLHMLGEIFNQDVTHIVMQYSRCFHVAKFIIIINMQYTKPFTSDVNKCFVHIRTKSTCVVTKINYIKKELNYVDINNQLTMIFQHKDEIILIYHD